MSLTTKLAGAAALALLSNAAIVPVSTKPIRSTNSNHQHIDVWCPPPKRLSADYKCLPPFKYNNADKIAGIVVGSIVTAVILGIGIFVLYKKCSSNT